MAHGRGNAILDRLPGVAAPTLRVGSLTTGLISSTPMGSSECRATCGGRGRMPLGTAWYRLIPLCTAWRRKVFLRKGAGESSKPTKHQAPEKHQIPSSKSSYRLIPPYTALYRLSVGSF